MNLLAHLYLSGGINDLMLGNYIGDFVKGNKYLKYPETVQKGIILHRKIDEYTDKHPIHKQSRDRFREGYRLFSGVIVDILYDHYLANLWLNYSNESLNNFAHKAYNYIKTNEILLPDAMKKFSKIMIQHNWILQYKSLTGLRLVYKGMARNTSLPAEYNYAMQVIEQDYEEIEKEFIIFFNDLTSYVDI